MTLHYTAQFFPYHECFHVQHKDIKVASQTGKWLQLVMEVPVASTMELPDSLHSKAEVHCAKSNCSVIDWG